MIIIPDYVQHKINNVTIDLKCLYFYEELYQALKNGKINIKHINIKTIINEIYESIKKTSIIGIQY